MLILTRTVGQRTFIDVPGFGRIEVELVALGRGKARIGFVAPEGAVIRREEIAPQEDGTSASSEPQST